MDSTNAVNTVFTLNSLPLRTFAYSLDPDQARQNVGPDLDPICLKEFFCRRQKSMKHFLGSKVLKAYTVQIAFSKFCP